MIFIREKFKQEEGVWLLYYKRLNSYGVLILLINSSLQTLNS